jgi:hypothetical protein
MGRVKTLIGPQKINSGCQKIGTGMLTLQISRVIVAKHQINEVSPDLAEGTVEIGDSA